MSTAVNKTLTNKMYNNKNYPLTSST